MPFAAIYIPDFPVEAIVRAEPELREHAVAIVEGAPPLVRVIAVNEKAAQAGVELGMTKLQADEQLAAISKHASTVRQRSAEREAAAHTALLDCACGFSPRVEDTAADTVALDLAGLERIFGPPAKMARDIARRCSELGLEANVAAASNVDTAVLAARGFSGVTVIAEGKEAERLGELSVEILLATDWGKALPIADCRLPIEKTARRSAVEELEILETLERWGVRNLRALAALPEVAVAERLGQEGLHLQKLARGETQRPLVVAEPPLRFEEAVELEYPVDLLEPLAFLLNRMLEQLCARLAARALATNELTLRFELEANDDLVIGRSGDRVIENPAQITGSPDHQMTRCLRLPVPLLDAKVFLKLLQLDLQAHPPPAPVTRIWLRAEPAEPRRAQNGLFVPQEPEAEKLSVTLARIERVVGKSPVPSTALGAGSGRRPTAEARVGSPEILDTHRLDGFCMKPFAASGQWPVASGQELSVGEGARGIGNFREGKSSPGEAPGPTGSKTTGTKKGGAPLTALRVFRPPLAAVVTVRDGRPVHLASPERPTMRGEVVWCAGPWRASGEWWTEQAWSRAEWDVAVRNEEGVSLYRIYHDGMKGKWFVEGTYD